MPSSTPNFLDNVPTPTSNDDGEDENKLPLAHFPPLTPAQLLPLWVHSICEAAGGLASDPIDQC